MDEFIYHLEILFIFNFVLLNNCRVTGVVELSREEPWILHTAPLVSMACITVMWYQNENTVLMCAAQLTPQFYMHVCACVCMYVWLCIYTWHRFFHHSLMKVDRTEVRGWGWDAFLSDTGEYHFVCNLNQQVTPRLCANPHAGRMCTKCPLRTPKVQFFASWWETELSIFRWAREGGPSPT